MFLVLEPFLSLNETCINFLKLSSCKEVPFGNYFSHVLSWWAHKDDDNVLILKELVATVGDNFVLDGVLQGEDTSNSCSGPCLLLCMATIAKFIGQDISKELHGGGDST